MADIKIIDGYSCQPIGDLNGDGNGDHWCNRTTSEQIDGRDVIKVDYRIYFNKNDYSKSGICPQSGRVDSAKEKYFCYTGQNIAFFSSKGQKFTIGQSQKIDDFQTIDGIVKAFQIVMKIETNGTSSGNGLTQVFSVFAVTQKSELIYIRSLNVN